VAFHDVRFPIAISYGSRGGPGTSTSIVETDSGLEERVARWSRPRWRFDARWGVKTLADLYSVQRFYAARLGPLNSFRYKDWLDFTSAADGRSAHAATDVTIGTGDASKTAFQLVKKYVDGAYTTTREITKPVSGTVLIALDGVTQGSGFTVNALTGIVTFTTAPGSGVAVQAGFELDVPVRFGEEVDEAGLLAAIEDFDSGEVPAIPLVEELSGVTLDEEFPFGRSATISFGANLQLADGDARVQRLTATAASLSVLLPDPTSLPTGGVWFYLYNAGTNAFAVKQSAATVVSSVAAGGLATILLTAPSGVKTWVGVAA